MEEVRVGVMVGAAMAEATAVEATVGALEAEKVVVAQEGDMVGGAAKKVAPVAAVAVMAAPEQMVGPRAWRPRCRTKRERGRCSAWSYRSECSPGPSTAHQTIEY